MKFTPGKLAGMKAVSNERGVIAAAAMDQRGSPAEGPRQGKGRHGQRPRHRGIQVAGDRGLTPHATAILLDPEWGLPASKRRAKNAGLLMAYEKTGYDAVTSGGLPICSTTGRSGASRKPAPTASRSCSTTPRSTRRTSTTRNTRGSSGSATSAAPTIFPSFSSSSATKRAPTKRGSNTRRRSPRSSPAAWRNSRRIDTAWTS